MQKTSVMEESDFVKMMYVELCSVEFQACGANQMQVAICSTSLGINEVSILGILLIKISLSSVHILTLQK